MFDELDLDLDLDTVSEISDDTDLMDLCGTECVAEYVTKSEAIKDIINSQDPDLTYVSRDGIKWEAKSNSEDPAESDWTNYNEFYYLNGYSVLGALEEIFKKDSRLLDTIVSNLL